MTMLSRASLAALTGAALALCALPALAKDLCAPAATPVSEESVLKSLADQGFTKITKLVKEDGCLEGKGFDKTGARVEVYVNPANGEIVKIKGGQK